MHRSGSRARRAMHQRYDSGRASPSKRGYDWQWQTRTRPAHIAREPWCRSCMEQGRGPVRGTEVDHITPLSAGGTHAESNLQTLCHSCHGRKTAAEKRQRGGGGKKSGFLQPVPDKRGGHIFQQVYTK